MFCEYEMKLNAFTLFNLILFLDFIILVLVMQISQNGTIVGKNSRNFRPPNPKKIQNLNIMC